MLRHEGHAEPGLDEAEHRVQLAALDGERRGEPGPPAGVQRVVAQVVAGAEHDHRRSPQVGDRAAGPRWACPTATTSGSRQDRLGVQGRVGALRRQHDQRQVELAAAAGRATRSCEPPSVDVQLDPGVGVVEARAAPRGDERRAQARGGAQPHPAAAQADEVLHLPPRGVDVGEDAPGPRQQRLAGRRSGRRRRGPVNSGAPSSASRVWICLLSEGWVTPISVGRLGEMAVLGHRDEVPELLRAARHSLRLSSTTSLMHWTHHRRRPSVERWQWRPTAIRTTVGAKTSWRSPGCCWSLFLVATWSATSRSSSARARSTTTPTGCATIGEPVLPYGWYLWIQRAVLTGRGRRAHRRGDGPGPAGPAGPAGAVRPPARRCRAATRPARCAGAA